MKIRKIIVESIGRENALKLYDCYKRCILSDGIIKSKSIFSKIGSPNSDYFIGYYDLTPERNGKLIFHKKNKNEDFVRICLFHLNRQIDEEIASSNAWNWQQGSRLRWISDEMIAFNDFSKETGRYFSRFLNINTHEEWNYDIPFYDISNRIGATLNFNELGYMRPGYGYTNIPFRSCNMKDAAVTVYSLDTEKIIIIIKYEDISYLIYDGEMRKDFYINHISLSPNAKRMIFFAITVLNDIHYAKLLTYDFEEKKLKVLEENLSVSHYCWISEDEVLITSYDEKRQCKYYTYNILKGEKSPFAEGILTTDGHPTVYSQNKIITDTYPDEAGYQTLYIADNNHKEEFFKIYHSIQCFGEKRCDLHPRFDFHRRNIFIDAAPKGVRCIFIINKEIME